MSRAIITFIKNPVKGHVKTRLARDIGEDMALKVYVNLMTHTRKVVREVDASHLLFYSQNIIKNDDWSESDFVKGLQANGDLGNRMLQAFNTALSKHDSAIIIGSDCPGISPEIIEGAFAGLKDHDVVVGPTFDGGYYLLGMNHVHDELFEGMPWSTDTVFDMTIQACQSKGLKFDVLTKLTDVDHASDMVDFPWLTH